MLLVCIYVSTEELDLIQSKVIHVLNSFANNPNKVYGNDDIETKSAIVVISNVPSNITDDRLNSILAVHGKTLTKVYHVFFFVFPFLSSLE